MAGFSHQAFQDFGIQKQALPHDEELSQHGDVFRAFAIITSSFQSIRVRRSLKCGYHEDPFGVNVYITLPDENDIGVDDGDWDDPSRKKNESTMV